MPPTEAAARQVDIAHYQNTGETRLDADQYGGEAHWAFETAVTNLRTAGLYRQLRQSERG